MRISDWSSDVCSSDLGGHGECPQGQARGRTRAVRASAQGSARSLRRGHAGASRPKKIAVPVGQGRGMIATIQQGLKDDGFAVSISQLCRWFGVPRRTVYYKPTKAPSKVNPDLAGPTQAQLGRASRRARVGQEGKKRGGAGELK